MSTRNTLDDFTISYIGAALWSSTDDQGAPLDAHHDRSDISDETIAKMAQDCAKFQETHAETLAGAYANSDRNFTPTRAGFCFWLNRNGHGSGFWDEEQLEPADRQILNEGAQRFGMFDLYVGDDGRIHA